MNSIKLSSLSLVEISLFFTIFSNTNCVNSHYVKINVPETSAKKYILPRNIEDDVANNIQNDLNSNYGAEHYCKNKNEYLVKYNPDYSLFSDIKIENYPNGKLRSISNYDQGLLHGNQFLYNNSGILTEIIHYNHGVKNGNSLLIEGNKIIKVEKYFCNDNPTKIYLDN